MANTTFVKKTRIPAPVEDVFAWHARPGALERLTPPWTDMAVLEKTGLLEIGTNVTLRLKAGPIGYKWHSRHFALEKNRYFADQQISGPFAVWIHKHRFHKDGGDCIYEDNVQYRLPFHPLSTLAAGWWAAKELDAMFAWRHETVVQDAALHQKIGASPMTIAISGASGMIGKTLVPFLTTGGHRVLKLVRREPSNPDEIFWDPARGKLNPQDLQGVDAIIHLAGDNIGQGSWTKKKKRLIIESRELGTGLLARAAAAMDPKPKVFLSASAIGYYGDRGDQVLTEQDGTGNLFISDVCDGWEKAAKPAVDAEIRTVFARIGVVLSPQGGALREFLPVFKLGLGGRIGKGKQYLSWIGIDDAVGSLFHLVCNENAQGPVNIVAPEPVTNGEFAKTLGRVLHRPAFLPVPAFAINLAFGEKGREVVLASVRVSAEKLLDSGYAFRYPSLETALRHMLGKIGDAKPPLKENNEKQGDPADSENTEA
ncbi:MAG: TIGR01777 family oxidoreductase [Desulfatibacillum sp.]|nr:TIGR01777 family oxidoreductase [Desulfatibacillum sp.]